MTVELQTNIKNRCLNEYAIVPLYYTVPQCMVATQSRVLRWLLAFYGNFHYHKRQKRVQNGPRVMRYGCHHTWRYSMVNLCTISLLKNYLYLLTS